LIERLLPPQHKVLIVPIDHGLTMGNLPGLEEPERLLQCLIDLGIDGTLLSPGLARRLAPVWRGRLSVTLTLDFQLLGERPGASQGVREVARIASPATAQQLGVDAVKMLMVWGVRDEVVTKNIELIAQTIEEARTAGLPVMVEPLWFGRPLPPEEFEAFVIHAARIAVELGAEILKIPVVSPQALEQITRWGVPVLFLGGSPQQDPEPLFKAIRAGLAHGVRGLVMGRNVWQNPNMEALISQLKDWLIS